MIIIIYFEILFLFLIIYYFKTSSLDNQIV